MPDGSLYKRCGCTELVPTPDGGTKRRQLHGDCPRLRRANGSWNPKHGTWAFQLQIPGTNATTRAHLRQSGHETSDKAQTALDEVTTLLALADKARDPLATRLAIADLIRPALKARTKLPDADAVRRTIGLGLTVGTDPTVDEYLVRWVADRKDLRPNAERSFKQQIRTDLAPRLKGIKLLELTVDDVQKAFNDMVEEQRVIADQNAQRHAVLAESKAAWREHRSYDARAARALLKEMPGFRRVRGAATIQRYLSCLSSALEAARAKHGLAQNVAEFVHLAEAAHHKPKLWTDERIAEWRKSGSKPSPVMVWTAEQTKTFLARAKKTDECGYPYLYYAAFRMIALLGTRRGETLALPKASIDYSTGAIDIAQQLVQYGWDTDIQPNTKTQDGARTVVATKSLLATLAKLGTLQDQQEQAARAAGDKWTETGLVFTDEHGEPIHPAKLNDALADIAKQCGLPPIRVHDLRHGVATQSRAEKVEDSVISANLGHSSKWFTAAFYGDVAHEVKRDASQKVAAAFALADDD
jgi:integrase